MKPAVHRRVQRHGWDRAATLYDQHWERQLAPATNRLLELVSIEAGERVLDVACGTGALTFPAAEAVAPDGEVVGTDISDEMIGLIGNEAERRGADNVRFKQMGAEELRFEAGDFDVVLCGFGLMYAAKPAAAISEMQRVLEPGGRVGVSVWGHRDRCGWAEVFPIVEARVSSEVCPLFFQLGTGDFMEYSLESAGFSDIAIERISTELSYETQDEVVTATFAAGPVAMAYSRFDEPTRDEAHQEYLSSIEEHRSDDGYRIPGEFVVATAVKPWES